MTSLSGALFTNSFSNHFTILTGQDLDIFRFMQEPRVGGKTDSDSNLIPKSSINLTPTLTIDFGVILEPLLSTLSDAGVVILPIIKFDIFHSRLRIQSEIP